ncbi:hypothetical protein DL766_001917 [Monosporascus sp. MC13-8B]|uniref:Uncharacterized protein n=1 Tax=Monosporascus cannonballus TaxID=155416 RepID=A0ABY0HM66_9PEZI|nr:hypothetical protein DL763_004712 [Monosporascus cannonballus]RYO93990.1 hypothetical protein DL762_000738 [Monosporascus cannonballus]RYP36677.1 hypothetical protein DL766_001917 [Monosporascus sp. MC13-8B]
MPALNSAAIVARDTFSTLAKREQNWAAQEPGVIVVFCIVFLVGCGLIGLWISKLIAKRRAKKQAIAAHA